MAHDILNSVMFESHVRAVVYGFIYLRIDLGTYLESVSCFAPTHVINAYQKDYIELNSILENLSCR